MKDLAELSGSKFRLVPAYLAFDCACSSPSYAHHLRSATVIASGLETALAWLLICKIPTSELALRLLWPIFSRWVGKCFDTGNCQNYFVIFQTLVILSHVKLIHSRHIQYLFESHAHSVHHFWHLDLDEVASSTVGLVAPPTDWGLGRLTQQWLTQQWLTLTVTLPYPPS